MAFYEINLAVLAVVNAFLLYRQRRKQRKVSTLSEDPLEAKLEKEGQNAVTRFKRMFYPAYVLVFAADWMQVCQLPRVIETSRPTIDEIFRDHISMHYTNTRRVSPNEP